MSQSDSRTKSLCIEVAKITTHNKIHVYSSQFSTIYNWVREDYILRKFELEPLSYKRMRKCSDSFSYICQDWVYSFYIILSIHHVLLVHVQYHKWFVYRFYHCIEFYIVFLHWRQLNLYIQKWGLSSFLNIKNLAVESGKFCIAWDAVAESVSLRILRQYVDKLIFIFQWSAKRRVL